MAKGKTQITGAAVWRIAPKNLPHSISLISLRQYCNKTKHNLSKDELRLLRKDLRNAVSQYLSYDGIQGKTVSEKKEVLIPLKTNANRALMYLEKDDKRYYKRLERLDDLFRDTDSSTSNDINLEYRRYGNGLGYRNLKSILASLPAEIEDKANLVELLKILIRACENLSNKSYPLKPYGQKEREFIIDMAKIWEAIVNRSPRSRYTKANTLDPTELSGFENIDDVKAYDDEVESGVETNDFIEWINEITFQTSIQPPLNAWVRDILSSK